MDGWLGGSYRLLYVPSFDVQEALDAAAWRAERDHARRGLEQRQALLDTLRHLVQHIRHLLAHQPMQLLLLFVPRYRVVSTTNQHRSPRIKRATCLFPHTMASRSSRMISSSFAVSISPFVSNRQCEWAWTWAWTWTCVYNQAASRMIARSIEGSIGIAR